MRLADADAYSAEMKERQEAAWKWRNEAIAEEDELKLARAEGAFTAFTEAKLTMDKHIISPWHRVEEPPEEHMWCFVYTHDPEMIMPIRIAFYVASCTGKGNWYHYESGEDIDDEVDYWTPMYLEGPDIDKDLPWPIEPPKEEEHGN